MNLILVPHTIDCEQSKIGRTDNSREQGLELVSERTTRGALIKKNDGGVTRIQILGGMIKYRN